MSPYLQAQPFFYGNILLLLLLLLCKPEINLVSGGIRDKNMVFKAIKSWKMLDMCGHIVSGGNRSHQEKNDLSSTPYITKNR